MMRGVIRNAKDFRVYPEGDEEPFTITSQISKDSFGRTTEARMEAGRCVRRLLQASAQRMIRTLTEAA